MSSIDWQTTALTSIQSYAFNGCTALKSINVPNTVNTIGSYAFLNCHASNASALTLPSALTSLQSYAFQGCYSLKSLSIPSGLTAIQNFAFAGCYGLSSIIDYRLIAQTIYDYTFGQTAASNWSNGYVGYATHSTGNNMLCVYAAAEGYDDGFWSDPLQESTKCGFSLKYIDPENVKYCNVMFNAGDGSIAGAAIYAKQLKQNSLLKTLPTPVCPEATPYFGGWYTGQNGTGTRYTAKSKVPAQSELMLYALYGIAPFQSYTVDLNDQWRASTAQANPDSSLYDGVYESNSNYNVNNAYAKAYIRIEGYTNFTIYIRTYTAGEAYYDYAIAMNLDTDVTSLPLYNSSGVKASTYSKSTSGTSVADYVKVEYTGIDGGSHYICVIYRKDSTQHGGTDRGYLLIPKNQ